MINIYFTHICQIWLIYNIVVYYIALYCIILLFGWYCIVWYCVVSEQMIKCDSIVYVYTKQHMFTMKWQELISRGVRKRRKQGWGGGRTRQQSIRLKSVRQLFISCFCSNQQPSCMCPYVSVLTNYKRECCFHPWMLTVSVQSSSTTENICPFLRFTSTAELASLWNFFMILFSFTVSAVFPLLSKSHGSIYLGHARPDHRESISWHVLVPWPAPVPVSLCVCPWHSVEKGEMKELLCWCQSQMPCTTTHSRHRLFCLHSPLTLSGRGPVQTCRWPH